jgi:NitT/TauT family transport system substrate-binding protein
VDAVVAIEPYVTIGKSDPKLRLLSYNYIELQPVTEISSLVTTRPWAKKNPGAVAGFRQAIQEAAAFANTHPDEVCQVLMKYVPLEDAILQKVVLPHFMEDSLDEARLNSLIQRMREAKWLQRKFQASDIIYKEK